MADGHAIGIQMCGEQWHEAELRRAGGRLEVLRLTHRDAPGDSSPPTTGDPPVSTNSTVLVASIAGRDVMSRCWTLPVKDDDRTRQMVALRLEADLPVAMNDLTWGFRRLGAVSGGASAQSDVLVQAARTERVTRQTTALAAAGFDADVVTTESEALGALCRHGLQRDGQGTEALILADTQMWLVAVLVDGTVRSVRRVSLGAGGVEAACRECQQSIAVLVRGQDLRRITWCASAELDAARSTLAATLNVAIEPVTVPDTLVNGDGQRLGADQVATFGPAIGLALAGLFEREAMIRLAGRAEVATDGRQERIDRWLARPLRWLGAVAALLILAGGAHAMSVWWDVHTMRDRVAQGEEARAARATLEPKVRAMKRLETYRLDIERIVGALSNPLPDGIVLTSLTLSRERNLTLKGTAQPPKLIFALADALRKSPRFREVRPGRTNLGEGGGFTLTAELVDVRKLQPSRRRRR